MAFTKITTSDLSGKGVVGLPDTPQLTTEEMQQKFDELALSVLVPAFNRLVGELGAQSAASNIGISLPEGSALDSNVAAVINWMLSDISESDQLRHSHSNKAVLDLITLAVKTGYDRLVTLLASITEISATVKNSADSIPTGKAISEYISGLGGGDMLKSVYDTDNTGVVDNSEKLGGQLPSFYQKATDNTLTTANKTISGAINEINGKEVEVVDPMTAIEPGTAADAKLTGDALKELNAKMGGLKFKHYNIAPRNWAKGITNIVDLDIDPTKIMHISGIIYSPQSPQAWVIPAIPITPSTGDYNGNYAVTLTLLNQTLRVTFGIQWDNYALNIVVGYID